MTCSTKGQDACDASAHLLGRASSALRSKRRWKNDTQKGTAKVFKSALEKDALYWEGRVQ